MSGSSFLGNPLIVNTAAPDSALGAFTTERSGDTSALAAASETGRRGAASSADPPMPR